MSDDLKSCPFCGSDDLGSGGDDKVVAYWCNSCQATGPNHYGRYEWNSRADRIEELEAELHLLKTSGIAEVAVRNQNVMEYMRHWEGRAEAAEAELEKQLKIAAANEESEGAASFRVSRFMYEMTGGKDE